MALKRIWNLPVNTHCDIVHLLSSHIPIDIQLKCRFFKFYRSLLKSENSLISFLSRFKKFSSNSNMGKNVNKILYDLKLDLYELEMLFLNKIKSMYYQKWISGVNGLYVTHSK